MGILRQELRHIRFSRHPLTSLLLVGMLIVAVVSACSNTVDQSFTPSNHSTDECRTVKYTLGETCIPIQPQRVVALMPLTLGNAVALDIKLIGAAHGSGGLTFPGYLQGKVNDIDSVDDVNSPNLEKILLLKPDLILAYSLLTDIYGKLSQIAPTIILEFPPMLERSWKQLLEDLAIALNKTKTFNSLMDEYWQRIDNLKQALSDQHQKPSISVATVSASSGLYVYGKKHPVSTVLNDVGLHRPPAQRGNLYYIGLSKEKLPDIDGDVLFLLTNDSDQDSKELLEKLQQEPLWKQLKVVQKNRVYPVNSKTWHSIDILAINAILDDLFKYLVNTP